MKFGSVIKAKTARSHTHTLHVQSQL